MKSQGILITAILALTISGCGQTEEETQSAVAPPVDVPTESAAEVSTQTGSAPVDYNRPESWLCRPDREDFCKVDLTTTVIKSDGTTTRETFTVDSDAPIDCFYVYPTVSMDSTPNSDLTPVVPVRHHRHHGSTQVAKWIRHSSAFPAC